VSFSTAVARHLIRTELGLPLSVNKVTQASPTAWRVDFPNNIAVYVTFAYAPDFVAAARWYPKPAGPSHHYTYSCTWDGRLVLNEHKRP
jgi:hypothetical protein